MLDAMTDYFVTLSPAWLYLALFSSAYLENIIPLLPGDTVTVFAAYLVGRSQERFAGVLISTTAGSLAGFMTLYALGRLIHRDYFIRRDFRFLPAAQFIKAGKWFERYGLWMILVNRFFSGVRAVISLLAGLYRLPWPRVLLLAGIGCAAWNGLLLYAGFTLGANWKRVGTILAQYNRILLVVAATLLLAWLGRRIYRRERRER